MKTVTLSIAAILLVAMSANAAPELSREPTREPTTEQKIDALIKEVEELKAQTRGGDSLPQHVSIGGYGELHYNDLKSKNEIDLHRFVLFFGYRFTDKIRFVSEFELEHALAGEGKKGEVEIEQAYIDFDLIANHTARGGLFLVPVGILNETHEPPTFYGVERNPIETNIIPTTWWEGGAALHGQIVPGLAYDVAFTSGLGVPTTGANAFLVRSGRQKVSEAKANDPAYTARVKWTAVQGLELAASVQYQQDVTQSALLDSVRGILSETHVIVTHGPFAVRALYARWDLDGDAPKAVGRDEQVGWYIEPAYRILPSFGVFVRYNEWDNEAGDAVASKKKQTSVGVNYWPHEQIAIKFDVQDQRGAINDDGFNIGIGFMF